MSNFNPTRYAPFGFDQGDPLIVCRNEAHMRQIQEAFQIKAYYCLWGALVGGRRHDRIIVFNPEYPDEARHIRWINESLATKLTPGGKIHYV